jgi:hypothetical protein
VWIAYVINVAIGAFLLTNINGTPLVHVTMPFGFIVVVTTSLTSLSILYLCDRNGGPIVMTRLLCARRDLRHATPIAYSQESTVAVAVSLGSTPPLKAEAEACSVLTEMPELTA